MPRPLDIGVIDTLIGFRDVRQVGEVPAARGEWTRHPAEYMFKTIPEELKKTDDPFAAIDETVEKMDAHGIRVGVIHLEDPRSPEALRRYPDRFAAVLSVDANQGMDAVRAVQKASAEYDIRGIALFPSGLLPPVPLNDKHWYPIYAKCIELDIAVLTTVGVPGPRVPMMPQYVGHLDEVCYDFPELKVVMRHGAEPWEALAVKLMLKWPNLYYSTTGFAPRYWPEAIIKFANSRGSDKIMYGGYYPAGLELERIFSELDAIPFRDAVWPKFLRDNAAKVLRIVPPK